MRAGRKAGWLLSAALFLGCRGDGSPALVVDGGAVDARSEAACGNGTCDRGECISCVGDCPLDCVCGDHVCRPGEEGCGLCPEDCTSALCCGDGICNGGDCDAFCEQDCLAAGSGCASPADACGEGQRRNCHPIPSCGDGICDLEWECPSRADNRGGCTADCANKIECVCHDDCCSLEWDEPCLCDGLGTNFCHSESWCTPTCAHPMYETGGPLAPACDACVGTVCGLQPSCCDSAWDIDCVHAADLNCAELPSQVCPGSH